jgi:hypothetical protein
LPLQRLKATRTTGYSESSGLTPASYPQLPDCRGQTVAAQRKDLAAPALYSRGGFRRRVRRGAWRSRRGNGGFPRATRGGRHSCRSPRQFRAPLPVRGEVDRGYRSGYGKSRGTVIRPGSIRPRRPSSMRFGVFSLRQLIARQAATINDHGTTGRIRRATGAGTHVSGPF